MNNQLQTLQYYQSMDVRMVMQDGETWWVLADVCKVLGLTNSRMTTKQLDDDEKGVSQIYTPGGPQEMTIINESGLYSVILRSDKPEAKAFKRWITHEVLPSIRRTGTYSVRGISPYTTVALPSMAKLAHGATAQHLWLVLLELDRAQGGTGIVQVSNSELTRLLGVKSRHTVMNARRELIVEGLVEFTQGTKGSPSTYHLHPTR